MWTYLRDATAAIGEKNTLKNIVWENYIEKSML